LSSSERRSPETNRIERGHQTARCHSAVRRDPLRAVHIDPSSHASEYVRYGRRPLHALLTQTSQPRSPANKHPASARIHLSFRSLAIALPSLALSINLAASSEKVTTQTQSERRPSF
jgi:hypothetical protein